MALDYSPQFNPEGKNAYNTYKVVPSSNSSGKNDGGYTYKNYTTNFDTITDLYPTSIAASERSYNLGCSGYRKLLITSVGSSQYAPCQTSAEYVTLIGGIPKGDMERRYYLFDQTENVFDVTESINDTALTLGLGLPVGGALSNINLGMEYGKRGTTNAGLIQENYLNISIGLSFNDKWFVKRKFD